MFQAYRGAEPPHFVNEAELEYAKLLDYYGVPWMYEPHTFVLARDEDGRVTEAFTPDFYLPDQDLYLEVTVMKQSLVTRKNRKLRKLLRPKKIAPRLGPVFVTDVERKSWPLKLDGSETFTITGVAGLRTRQDVEVKLTRADGSSETFLTRCRIDTVNELEYFLNGGILQYVLRKLAA